MGFIIYLIGIVDGIITAGEFFSAFSILGILISGIMYSVFKSKQVTKEKEKEEKKENLLSIKKIRNICIGITIFCLPISLLLPDSKTIAAIYLIPKIVENEQVQKLPDKVLTIFNAKLDQWIKEIKIEKGKSNEL